MIQSDSSSDNQSGSGPLLGSDWFSEIEQSRNSAFSLKLQERLHSERTPYQQIEIFATKGYGNFMVIDGCTMLSGLDNFIYHEMMTHPALLTHPAPRRVAIIGGGDCGSLREVLKHDDIEHAWQVEIDQRVTRLSEQFFPELCVSNDDPRAELLFDDGIRWMNQRDAESLDIVIVDSTDPIGPAEGLFGEPFYRDCLKALGSQGILVQQSESPLLHLESVLLPMHRAMRAAGFQHTQTLLFPLSIYPSGWWSATLASSAPLQAFRAEAADPQRLKTRYYNADIHRGAAALPEFMRQLLATS